MPKPLNPYAKSWEAKEPSYYTAKNGMVFSLKPAPQQTKLDKYGLPIIFCPINLPTGEPIPTVMSTKGIEGMFKVVNYKPLPHLRPYSKALNRGQRTPYVK